MTPEEILDKVHWEFVIEKGEATKAITEYAKDIAIEFVKWMEEHDCHKTMIGGRAPSGMYFIGIYATTNKEHTLYTISELYSLFLEQRQNKQQ